MDTKEIKFFWLLLFSCFVQLGFWLFKKRASEKYSNIFYSYLFTRKIEIICGCWVFFCFFVFIG